MGAVAQDARLSRSKELSNNGVSGISPHTTTALTTISKIFPLHSTFSCKGVLCSWPEALDPHAHISSNQVALDYLEKTTQNIES